MAHINTVRSKNSKINYNEFIWLILQEQSTYSHWWKNRRPASLFFGLPFISDCVGVKLWHPLFSRCHSEGPTSIHRSADLVQINDSKKNTQFKMSTIDACEQSQNLINNENSTHDHLFLLEKFTSRMNFYIMRRLEKLSLKKKQKTTISKCTQLVMD